MPHITEISPFDLAQMAHTEAVEAWEAAYAAERLAWARRVETLQAILILTRR